MTAHELLVLGREVLIISGWTKRTMRDSYGHVCAVGALQAVLPDVVPVDEIPSLHEARRHLGRAAKQVVPEVMRMIPGVCEQEDVIMVVNDHHKTTYEQILAIFDLAIEATIPEPVIPEPERELLPA